MKRLLVLALFVSFGAQARPYGYECYSYEGDTRIMDLTVNPRKATAMIREDAWNITLGGNLVQNYRSRGDIPFVKYGKELIVEKSLLTGGRRLRDGNWGGLARVEGKDGGEFFQYKFICKLK